MCVLIYLSKKERETAKEFAPIYTPSIHYTSPTQHPMPSAAHPAWGKQSSGGLKCQGWHEDSIDMGEAEDHTFQEQPPFRWDSLSDIVSNFKQNSKGKEDYTFLLPKWFHNIFVNYPVISKERIHINGSFPQFHLGIRRLQWQWGLLWVVILGIYPNFVTI